MSSLFFRIVLGCFLMFGLAFPAVGWAQSDTAGEATADQSETAIFQAQADTYQAEGIPQASDEVFRQGPSPRATTSYVLNYAIYGAAIGGLIGLGGYLLSGMDWSPWTIVQFAGGGAVVGAGVGLVLALTQEDTPAVASSVDYLKRDLPKAVKVPMINLKF
ncbi:MAG: hypothetical protein H0U74_10200 [Bradymonadaceae bacterium]|nr:hypothetical protein [Lujinxingiaceae bacterium]